MRGAQWYVLASDRRTPASGARGRRGVEHGRARGAWDARRMLVHARRGDLWRAVL